jgi:hypothetical protein
MSAAILAAERSRISPLHVVRREVDPYLDYWRAVLTGELLDCDNLPYARRLRRMLDSLSAGVLVLPLRCRTCGEYFNQPLGPVAWLRYCSSACRKNFPRRAF